MRQSPTEIFLTNKIKELELKLNNQSKKIAYLENSLISPVPEINFFSVGEQSGSGGTTTYVNTYKGQVTIVAGTNISILNTTNTITITNTYTLPTDVLTSASTYVKTIPTDVLTNTSTYVKTIPADVLTNSSTYIKALTAGTGITLTTTATTKSIEITSSGSSSGGGVNVSYYSTTDNFVIDEFDAHRIGAVKTSANGVIQVSLALYTTTSTVIGNIYIANSTNTATTASYANLGSIIISYNSFNNPIGHGSSSPTTSAKGAVLINAVFSSLTVNTSYNIYIVNNNSANKTFAGYATYLQGS